MALRSGGRKLSFDILNADDSFDCEILLDRSISDPIRQNDVDEGLLAHGIKSNRRKRKKKKKKMIACSIEEDPITDKVIDAVFDEQKPLFYENKPCANDLDPDYQNYRIQTIVCEEITVSQESNEQVRTVHQISEPDYQNLHDGRQPLLELRQRTINGIGACDESLSHTNEPAKEDNSVELGSLGQRKPDSNGSVIRKLKTADSLDWKRLIAEDPSYLSSVEKSPVKYFLEEVYGGNSLRSTTTLGNEKERERVYDTIFRLPWRCELLICVGFFVCLDSFLSLLTIMPTRFLMTCWRYVSTRQFQKPSAADLSDLGCFIVLACGVTLLQGTDISLIYHMIRGQGTIKLYVVYNVLEIFDKLFQNFGGDVMQTLFNSAEGLSNSAPEKMRFWLWRFISDQMLAVVASIAHSFVLLAQAITLSTCIVAHNNALLALLVSNNFAEIKSNVFKRLSKGNIHNLVYNDSVERFHISAFLLFVLAQNILEAEGPWFGSFIYNALMVYYCEVMIDIIKHSFIAKFNEIKPIAYSEFLEDLCRQTLNIQGEDENKTLTFVPLAPACVVIRVLTPVYAAHLPYGPLPWRLLWIFLLSIMTCVMLTSLKVLIGMCLHKHATWYVDRCQKRKHHFHAD